MSEIQTQNILKLLLYFALLFTILVPGTVMGSLHDIWPLFIFPFIVGLASLRIKTNGHRFLAVVVLILSGAGLSVSLSEPNKTLRMARELEALTSQGNVK